MKTGLNISKKALTQFAPTTPTLCALVFMLSACQVVQDSRPVSQDLTSNCIFKTNSGPNGFLLGSLHTIEGILDTNLPEGINCESLGLDLGKFDLWMMNMNEADEVTGVYGRCSEQHSCSLKVDVMQADVAENHFEESINSRCLWTITAQGFLFNENGSVFPMLVHEEYEFYDLNRSKGFESNLKIDEAHDLWVSFNMLENFVMMQGLIGVFHAVFVDEEGNTLWGGEIELDFDDANFLQTEVELYSHMQPNSFSAYKAVAFETVFAQSTGQGSITVRATAPGEYFEKTVQVTVLDESDIAGIRFFEVRDRTLKTFHEKGLPYGIDYSLLPIQENHVFLEQSDHLNLHGFYTLPFDLAAMLLTQSGEPVFPNHTNGVLYNISFGEVLHITPWNHWASPADSLSWVVDADDNAIFARPDIWTIIGYEEGTASMEATWGSHETTLSIDVTAP